MSNISSNNCISLEDFSKYIEERVDISKEYNISNKMKSIVKDVKKENIEGVRKKLYRIKDNEIINKVGFGYYYLYNIFEYASSKYKDLGKMEGIIASFLDGITLYRTLEKIIEEKGLGDLKECAKGYTIKSFDSSFRLYIKILELGKDRNNIRDFMNEIDLCYRCEDTKLSLDNEMKSFIENIIGGYIEKNGIYGAIEISIYAGDRIAVDMLGKAIRHR